MEEHVKWMENLVAWRSEGVRRSVAITLDQKPYDYTAKSKEMPYPAGKAFCYDHEAMTGQHVTCPATPPNDMVAYAQEEKVRRFKEMQKEMKAMKAKEKKS